MKRDSQEDAGTKDANGTFLQKIQALEDVLGDTKTVSCNLPLIMKSPQTFLFIKVLRFLWQKPKKKKEEHLHIQIVLIFVWQKIQALEAALENTKTVTSPVNSQPLCPRRVHVLCALSYLPDRL